MSKDLEHIFLNALENSQEKIFRVCISFTENMDDAKDLFQEVLVNIWKSLPSFQENSSLSTWIYRITINVGLRFKTNLIKDKTKFLPIKSVLVEHIEPQEEQRTEEKKLMLLRTCIRGLNEVDKAIITLFLEEISYKEISNIIGLKENTVAVRIKRIKRKLQNCMNEKL